MTRASIRGTGRYVIAAVSVAMALAFFFPLWKIDLWAPQYPEGLRMWIGIRHVTGDLGQINILNHYIGMQKIIPGSIPELHLMPGILALLILSGLAAAWINRRWSFVSWLVFFFGVGVVGLYDFHRWNYNFGHNLNPDAPIKIPGMAYTPPVFGQKSLLNIVVYSYPDWGGIALFVAFGLGLFAVYLGGKPKGKVVNLLHLTKIASLLLITAYLGSCNASPTPIQTGVDACETCRMTISDLRFGSEIITDKGRIYKFDSPHCMIHYYVANRDAIRSVLIDDFLTPGRMIDARSAKYILTQAISAPMGASVLAADSDAEIHSIQAQVKTKGGELEWNALLASSP